MEAQHFRVSKRYARALLELAEEHHIPDRAYEDMQRIGDAFAANQDLKVLMKSPIVREARKQRILHALFSSSVHPLILHYMQIIVRKQRASLLQGISRAFLLVYKEHRGIEPVRITTAKPLDAPLREKALEVARKLSPGSIEFTEAVDPAVIGGFVLNLGDRQYDASIRTRLVRLKKRLHIQ